MIKRKKEIENFHTWIGTNSIFKGEIESKGSIRIDGKIVGDLKIEGDLLVGKTGIIEGNIISNNIRIFGSVNGNIIAKNALMLLSSANLIGDVQVSFFTVELGGLFQGKCSIKSSVINENSVVNQIYEEKKRNNVLLG